MATVKNSGRFTIKRISVKNGGFTYTTYRLSGALNGVRVRKNFKDRQEALGEKNRLEVAAANEEGATAARNTSLTTEQLREAEAAFHRLADRSLSLAVDHFIKTYREPKTDLSLDEVAAQFLEEKKVSRRKVSSVTIGNYRQDLREFCAIYGRKKPHEITSINVHDFLDTRRFIPKQSAANFKLDRHGKPELVRIGAKRWNNYRGNLHHFFNWCRTAPRKWILENPVAEVEKYSTHERDVPVVMTPKECIQLMQFVVAYKGGALVPYFALALFAGIRPSVTEGELLKLANHPKLDSLIDFDRGIIQITKEVAKVRAIRQIKIRPNLREWLEAYPWDKFPIAPRHFKKLVTEARKSCDLTGKDDILRHTFISMHVARFKSLGEAALEGGNSEAVIRKHYLNLFTEADAEVFWNITPQSIDEHGDIAAKVRIMIAQIERKKAAGATEISADEIYEVLEQESWGKAELDDRLYQRDEHQGWRGE
jgi:hypothetical protein